MKKPKSKTKSDQAKLNQWHSLAKDGLFLLLALLITLAWYHLLEGKIS